MAEHTVKAFDNEIEELRALIAEMGGRAEAAFEGAMNALARRDTAGARDVVSRDQQIDELETRIEKLAIQIIALRAPMANDLREVIAALKIIGIIERIGDYAKNIAKRVPLVLDQYHSEPITLLPSMGQIAGEMVRDALDAFSRRLPDMAVAVVERDRVVDDFYNTIFRTLLTYMAENPRSISQAAHLLFIAKNIERIGDHATNMAEMIYYANTGERMEQRAKITDSAAG